MSATPQPASRSFVLLTIGDRRFALPSESVSELVVPGSLQTFPHTTPLLTGVLVRRGRIVPVCDLAPVLVGPGAPPRRFYLIARRRFGAQSEWNAIPVTGNCELMSAEMSPPPEGAAAYVSGCLPVNGENVDVLDIERVVAAYAAPAPVTPGGEAQP
jgi:chemotaxis signal transduction protein